MPVSFSCGFECGSGELPKVSELKVRHVSYTVPFDGYRCFHFYLQEPPTVDALFFELGDMSLGMKAASHTFAWVIDRKQMRWGDLETGTISLRAWHKIEFWYRPRCEDEMSRLSCAVDGAWLSSIFGTRGFDKITVLPPCDDLLLDLGGGVWR